MDEIFKHKGSFLKGFFFLFKCYFFAWINFLSCNSAWCCENCGGEQAVIENIFWQNKS